MVSPRQRQVSFHFSLLLFVVSGLATGEYGCIELDLFEQKTMVEFDGAPPKELSSRFICSHKLAVNGTSSQ